MTRALSTWPFAILCFLLGPLMALAPRMVYLWPLLAALSLLPVLYKNRKALRAALTWRTGALLAAALLYTAASAGWSPSPRALEMAGGLAGLGLCGTVLFLALPFIREQQERLLVLFLSGMGLGLGFLCSEFFLGHPLHRWAEGLADAEAVNPNVIKRMAALFALAIWPFALIVETRTKRWLACLCVFAFFILAGFMTSRSAVFGMLIGMIVLFFSFHQAALARWVLMSFIGFGIIFTPPLFALLPLAPHDITGRFFDSAQARMQIWALTAEHVVKAPLFGNGIDASRGIESVVSEKMVSFIAEGASIISQHPHNVFLQIWLDLGLLGALLWGGLMLLLIDRTRFLPETAQPYVLAALYCSVAMLSTTFSVLQAWWAGGHIAVAALLFMAAYSFSRKSGTSGTSAGSNA